MQDFQPFAAASFAMANLYDNSRGPNGPPGKSLMPCYLFTYHAHGSWMPDHPRGYVRRHEGILAPDKSMAVKYRANMAADAVSFDAEVQRLLIDEVLIASDFQKFRCHYIAMEPTHLHLLVSWTIARDWKTVRAKVRESLTRRLNRELGSQDWFSKSPSRKQVKERKHFDYLVSTYLPRHSGLKWSEGVGFIL
jgi:hypothetical protein